jgi:hypothetical protein
MKEGEDSKQGCRDIIQIGMGAFIYCGDIYYGTPEICEKCKAVKVSKDNK